MDCAAIPVLDVQTLRKGRIMGAPTWMQNVADSLVPDLSGRKKAAAQAAQDKADADKAAADAKAAADKAAAQKKVDSISFKSGGAVKASQKVPSQLEQPRAYKAGGMVRRGYGKARGA
jgi:membrane protein involved in colicin uptake